jgi:hypothetical protein
MTDQIELSETLGLTANFKCAPGSGNAADVIKLYATGNFGNETASASVSVQFLITY